MNQWPDQDYWMAAEGAAYIEAVESEELQRFCFHFDRLRTIIRTEQLEDPWLSIRRVLGRVRMRMLAMPVPFGSESMGIDAVLDELHGILKQIGSGDVNRSLVVSCLESLTELRSLSYLNPLADRVVEILETGDPHLRGVVVVNPEWIMPTTLWIRDRVTDVDVWSRKDGDSIPLQQLLVLPGRPQYFARRDEDTVPFITAPRSESTCFVQFDFLGLPKPVRGLLDPGSSNVSRQIRGGFRVPDVIIDDSPDEPELFDWEKIRYRVAERSDIETEEFAPARAVTFADGSHTFVLSTDEGMAQIATSDPIGKIKLISKLTEELDRGDVLIIRTGGSETGHIRDLADNHFGASQYRSIVDNWKQLVRRAVILEGGHAAARRAMGEASGAARNFDHWISEDAIKPRERADFDVVSHFAGLSDGSAVEVWDAMSKVLQAHIQAGQLIRDRLEEGLEGRSLQSLEDAEYVEVEIAGFGTLRASRIVGIAPFTDLVPHRFIGVINPREVN